MNNFGTTFDSILNDISSGQYSEIKKPDKDNLYYYMPLEEYKKNEIYCIYTKTYKTIELMYDYHYDNIGYQYYFPERTEDFKETKKLLNGDNIELYVNQRKIKFSLVYESDEIGRYKNKI